MNRLDDNRLAHKSSIAVSIISTILYIHDNLNRRFNNLYYSLHPWQPMTKCNANLLNLINLCAQFTKFLHKIHLILVSYRAQTIWYYYIHKINQKEIKFWFHPFQTSNGYHCKTKCLLSEPCSCFTVASSVMVPLFWCKKHFCQL